jgi:hypothetical protein
MGEKRNWVVEIVFKFWYMVLDSKQLVLNIFKLNLNWVPKRIKSNKFFGGFSNMKIWNLG